VIVVDTNVIAYLWLPGTSTSKAEALLQADPEWAAPVLWRSEFRNVLAGLLRRGEVDLETAIRLAEASEEHMRGREFSVGPAEVLERVVASRCSAYDCEFVVLAEELGVALVTTDRQVLKSFPQTAISLGLAAERV
jgi:predicted nucleic acid-binding protein